MLEHLNKFDENTVELINCFINQLSKPVCLVAHNGNQFDFPLLQKQLQKLVSHDQTILFNSQFNK